MSEPLATVVVTTIPTRVYYLAQAQSSVRLQTYPVPYLTVSDWERRGAAANRDAGLAQVTTKWTLFLDDDDILYPQHVRNLLTCAEDTQSDLVYPWFDVDGGTDPFPEWEGVPWDSAHPHQVPITHVVRTEAARDVGGFSRDWDPSSHDVDDNGNRVGEDFRYLMRLDASGARITHLPERTWSWRHHASNTSGLSDRW